MTEATARAMNRPAPTRFRVLVLITLLGSSSMTPLSLAADRFVDCQNGSDSTGDGTTTRPWKTIQRGVDNSSAGDVVRVKAGVCDDTNQLAFPVDMKAGVSVVGAGRTATFIKNQGAVTGVSAFDFAFSGANFPASQLVADMDIYSETDGVSLWNGSPTIRNNVIHGGTVGVNILTLYTGEAASPTLEDNTFTEVGTGLKAAALLGAVDPIVRRNWFLGHSSAGIAQYAINAQDVGIRHNLRIENNVMANSRIGMGLSGGSPTIRNNTISATTTAVQFDSPSGSQVQAVALDNNIIAYNDYGVTEAGVSDSTIVSMKNNDFFVNSVEDYFDWLLGPVVDPNSVANASGNVALNPTFVDPTRNDYHINPGSACRDAGATANAPADDIDKQGRVDTAPDIGADETSNIGLPNLKVTGHQLFGDFCPGSTPPGSDGTIDPGESADIKWEITNLSAFARATNVTATITGDAEIVPQPQTISFGKINPLKTSLSGMFSFLWTANNCGAKIRFTLVLSSTETGPLPGQSYEIKRSSCTWCSNPQKPDPRLETTDLEDECPNGVPPGYNGSIEPGETGHLTFHVKNYSAAARATQVMARITTSNPAVTPASADVLVGNIAPGATVQNPLTFDFTVNASQIACGASIVFDVALSWIELGSGAPTTSIVTLTVPVVCVNCAIVKPAFTLGSRTFADNCTTRPSNSQIDPGERVDLTVRVQNTSTQAGASNVTGTLHARTAGVSPLTVPLSFGNIAPGATAVAPPVQLRVDQGVPCGTTLNFDLELSSDQTGPVPGFLPFTLSVASPCSVCNDTPPSLSLSGPSLVDICIAAQPPGSNGQIDPGETVELTLNVFNSSNVAGATSVTTDISIPQGWVSPSAGTLFVGSVGPLQVKSSTFPYTFVVERGLTLCGQFIDVNVTINSLETGPVVQSPLRLLVDTCNVCPVPQPALSITGQSFVDRCPFGNPPGANGQIDPGELVDLALSVSNSSAFAPATGVTAVFSTSMPGITPSSGSVAGPDLAPGQTASLDAFSFSVDYSQVSCGATIPFNVRLSSIETGPLPVVPVSVSVAASGCALCREVVAGLLLYRATVTDVAPGWKPAALPLSSVSPGKDGAPWPRSATSPGSQDDSSVLGTATPLLLYRMLDGADLNQGNTLKVVKKPASADVTVSY